MPQNLLYRFPSSQSSSPTPEARHSWPTYRHAHQPQPFTENVRSEPGRKVSVSSFESLGSNSRVPLRERNENGHPCREASSSSQCSAMSATNAKSPKLESKAPLPFVRGAHAEVPQDSSPPNSSPEAESWTETYLSAACEQGERRLRDHTISTQPRLSFDVTKRDILSISPRRHQPVKGPEGDYPSIAVTEATKHPLKRLVTSVRRKSPSRRASLKAREERWSLDDFDLVQAADALVKPRRKSTRHSKSSSKSSSSIATAVKSATTSLVTPHNKRSSGVRRSQRTNKPNATNRFSLDSTREPIRVVDEAAWDRARQRRSILEELITSEESYVADLKVLVNVSRLRTVLQSPDQADSIRRCTSL